MVVAVSISAIMLTCLALNYRGTTDTTNLVLCGSYQRCLCVEGTAYNKR
jgi:hypothetical protein